VGFNAVHSVDAFLGDIKSGKWDAVLSQVSGWLGIVMGSLWAVYRSELQP
jgi:hypothetical protein